MTGKLYYLTTIGDWGRYAEVFANSHWIILDTATAIRVQNADTGTCEIDGSTRIVALIETDEGIHGMLESDAAFDALPHPLSPKPISDTTRRALSLHGIPEAASTFEATEALGQIHPLLKTRVF